MNTRYSIDFAFGWLTHPLPQVVLTFIQARRPAKATPQ